MDRRKYFVLYFLMCYNCGTMTESKERPEQLKDPLDLEEIIKQAKRVMSQYRYSELHKKIEVRDHSMRRR